VKIGHARIEVLDLRLSVHLGWTDEERARPQEVSIDCRIDFARPPAGAASDELADTVCYGELCELFRAKAASRPFRLIEALARALAEAALPRLGVGTRYEISVTKLHPPVDGLKGGARYTEGGTL